MPLASRNRLSLPEPAQRRQHDVTRQIVGFATQPIIDPRTHRRATGNTAAGVHECVSRIVIDRLRLQRIHDADIVGNAADIGEQRTDLLAGLPVLFERMLWPQTLQLFRILQLSDRLAFCEGLRNWLAVHFCQLRLVVKSFQMRRATRHAQMNNSLGLHRKMQRLHNSLPAISVCSSTGVRATGCSVGLVTEQSGQHSHTNTG